MDLSASSHFLTEFAVHCIGENIHGLAVDFYWHWLKVHLVGGWAKIHFLD